MATISITTEDEGATPSPASSSLSAPAPRSQPQAIPLSSVATLNLPTAKAARAHLGTKKKSESKNIHPGYSMFDWTRYTQTAGDLTGVGGQMRKVSQEELAKHNKDEDAWTVVRGVVYNITPFMKYHPGGKAQLMRGAGNDCTELFDKIHIWVNSESILQKCIVGVYTGGHSPALKSLSLKPVDTPTNGGTEESNVISLDVPSVSLATPTNQDEEESNVISLEVPFLNSATPTNQSDDVISLVVPSVNSATPTNPGGEGTNVISLEVPSVNSATPTNQSEDESSSYSDYLRTTWNNVTGYETSV